MTPQLVDHAHIDFCAAIGCNLVQLRRKMNIFISGRRRISAASQLHNSRTMLHDIARLSLSQSHITVIIVNNA